MSFLLYPKVWKANKGKHVSLCHAAPQTRLPNIRGELLGEVSHHGLWLGCSSSSTVPPRAFGKPSCAKHGTASGWPLPNLAALPRAGPSPPKCFPLCALIRLCTVALSPLLLTVATSRLFLKAGFSLKGIPEILASPLFPWALSRALFWVCKESYLKLRVHISLLLTQSEQQRSSWKHWPWSQETARKTATEVYRSESHPGTPFPSAWRFSR